jgi:hypothetical protein
MQGRVDRCEHSEEGVGSRDGAAGGEDGMDACEEVEVGSSLSFLEGISLWASSAFDVSLCEGRSVSK